MENKKFGIITFSNGYNYGAILQTYALQEYFKMQSCKPVIIDYLSEGFKGRYKINIFSKNPKRLLINLYLLPAELKKREKINSFRKEHFVIEDFDRIRKTQDRYQLFITGSDQVWNPEITEMDENFLLRWVNDNHKKASYAASIGMEQLSEKEEQVLRDNLATFDSHNICVREDGAQRIVKKVIGYEPMVVCDPTLLLSAEHWKTLAGKAPKLCGYVLVYLFRTTKEKERQIIDMANSRGLSVKWMRNPLHKTKGINYVNGLGVEEWLGYFLNAEYVITDSFHGFMFSLIFNKNFTLLPLGKDKSNDRFNTVLNRLDLTKRMSLDGTVWDTSDIDYFVVNQKLDEFVSESKKYISNIIKESGIKYK